MKTTFAALLTACVMTACSSGSSVVAAPSTTRPAIEVAMCAAATRDFRKAMSRFQDQWTPDLVWAQLAVDVIRDLDAIRHGTEHDLTVELETLAEADNRDGLMRFALSDDCPESTASAYDDLTTLSRNIG